MNSESLISSLLQFWTVTLLLIVARVSTFFVTFPIFRSSTIPKHVKVSLILAISVVSLMVASASPEFYRTPIHDHYVAYTIALGRELFLGGVLGYSLSLFFLPAQVAGYYIGQEMGLSMASRLTQRQTSQPMWWPILFIHLQCWCSLLATFTIWRSV